MALSLTCLEPRPMAQHRLICIPYSGAGPGAFRAWKTAIPDTIEPYALLTPGREALLAEPPYKGWGSLIAAMIEAWRKLPRAPLSVYGHSLGALIALEFVRALESEGVSVSHLCCGAMPWPGAMTARPVISDLPDDEFVRAMEKRFGALPDSFSHPEIRETTLPALRADLRLLEAYEFKGVPKLKSPLSVFHGADDPVTKGADLSLWRGLTTGEFHLRELSGGHFFAEDRYEQIISLIQL